MLPIFLCTIYGSRKLLKFISIATIVTTLIASLAYYFEHKEYVPAHRLMSICCLWALFGISYLIANSLVKSQAQQIDFIYDNSKRQLQLIEELKIEPMTGLYNKACLETCFVAYSNKYKIGIFHPTCCLIDIDFFKKVNDTYGHMAGDAVLRNLALIIKTNMGGIRRAFRFGGEEFVILWENEALDDIYKKVCDIKKEFCEATYDFAPDVHFSFSAGICKLDDTMSNNSWFVKVDETLYKAKQDGRDRIYIYENQNHL